jgi:pimeloyl-ACP methyl ester carboxylesterase
MDLPQTSFADDVKAVREVLDTVDGDVLLMGHSYGGGVITVAGDHPAVERLVFLTAAVLDADETMATMAAGELAGTALSELWDGVASDAQGRLVVRPEKAAQIFFGDCSEAEVGWALSHLRPVSPSCLDQVAGIAAWKRKPSIYVLCELDHAGSPDVQRILSNRIGGPKYSLPTSHSPFLSRPALVVDIILQELKEMV